MPRLFSTVIFLLISAHQLSIRTCSSADMVLFTPRTKWSNLMKQLSFNFCATRATRKKAAAMQDARASRLCELDLDVTPASFSSATTDRHELSRYVLEDLLSCKFEVTGD